MDSAQILPLSKIKLDDISHVGTKAYNQARLKRSGVPIPDGFVISANTYVKFITGTSLKNKILNELSGLDISDTKKLFEASEKIKTAFLSSELPEILKSAIKKQYVELCGEFHKDVAVRSSVTYPEPLDLSFAGQQGVFLNVSGINEVYRAVLKCFASLFEPKAIFYRTDKGLNNLKIGVAVIVERMVTCETSGVLFTENSITGESSEASIEAVYGEGSALASGELIPDIYVVKKEPFEFLTKEVATQKWQLVKGEKVAISKEYEGKQKLSDAKVKELVKLGMKIEEKLGSSCDIEWGLEKGKLVVFQVKKAVSRDGRLEDEVEHIDVSNDDLLLLGVGVSGGIKSGTVKKLKTKNSFKDLKKGDIVVTKSITTEIVPYLRKVSAVIVDEDSVTSNLMSIARELGVSMVVGTNHATSMLQDGEEVTVDGESGKVFVGEKGSKVAQSLGAKLSDKKTATKVMVSFSEPEIAKDVAKRNSDGVGLLRSEFMLARISEHPRKFIEERRQKEFVNQLAGYILEVGEAFEKRPVFYRACELRSSEFRKLKGGERFEEYELNPSLGLRGAVRHLWDPEVFKLELEAIKQVRNKNMVRNINLLIPFVRTVEDLTEVKKLVFSAGLSRSSSFKLWMVCEVPSTVILIADFLEEGVDGVLINLDNLFTLTLGVDRENDRVANRYMKNVDESLIWSLERVITACKKRKIPVSVSGQALHLNGSLVEKVVHLGASSLTVNPDVLEWVRDLVFASEHKLVKGKG